MKTDHPISVTHDRARVRVLYQGHLIADSASAITLSEVGYKPVHYFPREDVAMEFLSRSDRRTHCPYKGEASYFNILMDGDLAENAVWSYEDPIPAMEQIRGRLAFYPNQVEIYELGDPAHDAAIAEIVEHTDTGAGQSQLEHWPPNVSQPTA